MFDNKITEAIERMQERLNKLRQDQLDKLDATAQLELTEWTFFGDKATIALLHNVVTADEAQTLHHIHMQFKTASLAERMIFIQMMSELHNLGVI